MEIRRFFVTSDDIDGRVVTLAGDEFLHMAKVLRYKVGFKAYILANDGIERLCTVSEMGADHAKLNIDSEKIIDKRGVALTLYAGLLKNNKLDFVIQKAVELGVDRIVPFESSNCAETKFSRERANKIALEAAKQCGSAYLSEVGDKITFDRLLDEINNYDNTLIAYECERKRTLKDCAGGRNIALIVGPEGGFTEGEVNAVLSRGGHAVTLGRRVLRAETASIVASALLLDALGELKYDA